jgi:MFS family permease
MIMIGAMTLSGVHVLASVGDDPEPPLAGIGAMIGVHIVAMYAFSPVFGLPYDRTGWRAGALAGTALLAAGCLTAAVADARLPVLSAGLILLGLGWSACLVTGSTHLTDATRPEDRPAVQNLSDVAMAVCCWSCSAGTSSYRSASCRW